jgi:hypothetical protein
MTSRSDDLRHPVPRLTTSELTERRRALEQRLAMQTLPPSPPREELQQQLTEVIAEQDERARIRRANTHA